MPALTVYTKKAAARLKMLICFFISGINKRFDEFLLLIVELKLLYFLYINELSGPVYLGYWFVLTVLIGESDSGKYQPPK